MHRRQPISRPLIKAHRALQKAAREGQGAHRVPRGVCLGSQRWSSERGLIIWQLSFFLAERRGLPPFSLFTPHAGHPDPQPRRLSGQRQPWGGDRMFFFSVGGRRGEGEGLSQPNPGVGVGQSGTKGAGFPLPSIIFRIPKSTLKVDPPPPP